MSRIEKALLREERERIPADDCDLLQSIEQVARWKGITYGQARNQIELGLIPVYRQPGKAITYAFKSEIIETARKVLKKVSPRQR